MLSQATMGGNKQLAFRRDLSADFQLFSFAQEVRNIVSIWHSFGSAFLDFVLVSDSVGYHMLLFKLSRLGFSNPLVALKQSGLLGKTFGQTLWNNFRIYPFGRSIFHGKYY